MDAETSTIFAGVKIVNIVCVPKGEIFTFFYF